MVKKEQGQDDYFSQQSILYSGKYWQKDDYSPNFGVPK